MKKFRFYVLISLAGLIAATVCFLYFFDYLEREKPAIKLNREIIAIGKLKNIGITFWDQKSGLSNIIVEIVQDNKGHILLNEKIPTRGTKQKILFVSIDTSSLNLHDGPATVNIKATDYSIFRQ
jgi:hypothetical protein